MRIVITGGGTGGHIYPALEVGRLAQEEGHKIYYFGSFRGQEEKIVGDLGIPFTGFASEPLGNLRTIKGLKSLVAMQRARASARVALKKTKPNVVFSTGGYSAGPVVAAAKDLKIPYVLHTSDSVPARSSSAFAKEAYAFTCTFHSTEEFMAEFNVIRTGQPIRKELRQGAAGAKSGQQLVLVLGGSQGSQFLNEKVPLAAALKGFQTQVLHVCGPKNLESTKKIVSDLKIGDRYQVEPFLNAQAMIDAYLRATIVVARSGGTLAELALFGLPSVLIPLPSSAHNHQFHNAMEFVNMNAATLLTQADLTPETLMASISGWLRNGGRREVASRNLKRWDVPDATERIFDLVKKATK